MKKIFHYLCKSINWIIPFAILINSSKINKSFYFYVMVGYFAFVIVYVLWSTSRSRLRYQSCFFAGYILGLINIFTDSDTALEAAINATSSTISIGEKIILVVITVVAFTSKIITMIFETSDYNAESAWRHNNRLEEEIDFAVDELERAETLQDKHRAEARLERAKLRKERYKIDE